MSGLLIGTLILWLIVAIIVDRRRRLCGQLALPPLVEGGVVRAHRISRRKGGDQRRRLRPAVHPRLHARQYERAADADRAREGRRRHHPRPHAHRHRGRLLCPRPGHARGGIDRRRNAGPAHARARAAACSVVRQVRLRPALRRLRDDHGADARAARRICRPRESRGRKRRWPRTAWSSSRSRSPTSTRPTSNSSIPRTVSTPKV